jgi:hypothetical protein
VLAELDVVDMRSAAGLEHEDQLMLGPVKRPHAAVGLGPDAEILELAVGRFTGGEDLAEVPPRACRMTFSRPESM